MAVIQHEFKRYYVISHNVEKKLKFTIRFDFVAMPPY